MTRAPLCAPTPQRKAPGSRGRHRIIGALLLLLLMCLVLGCSDPPPERIIHRFESLTALLEKNKTDPDKLLEELEAFVEEHRGEVAADREAFEELSYEQQKDYEARYERPLRRSMSEFLSVTLEVQDRLRAHPEKLLRFQKLLGELR